MSAAGQTASHGPAGGSERVRQTDPAGQPVGESETDGPGEQAGQNFRATVGPIYIKEPKDAPGPH